MEIIRGCGNWQMTVRRNENSITILRASTCDADAVLPDELFGLPVTEIKDRALAPGASPQKGEDIQIRCGRPNGEFDNRRIRTLTLPRSLKAVGAYAFMNCRELHTLCLYDALEAIPSSAFMNCRSFSKILLTQEEDCSAAVLSSFIPWLAGEFDVTVSRPDGEILRLIFPEFYEDYVENGPTHFFNYWIEGAGYAYHNVFKDRALSVQAYDELWTGFFAAEHEYDSALRLAWYRLRYPCGLSPAAEAAYREYVCKSTLAVFDITLEENDIAGLNLLLSYDAFTADELSRAQDRARTLALTGATAVLLEAQHKKFSGARRRSFEL